MNELPMNEEYTRLLEKYLDGLRNRTLSIEDKVNLLEFYVNDRNTFVREKESEMDHGSDILKYVTWAWAVYVMIHSRTTSSTD